MPDTVFSVLLSPNARYLYVTAGSPFGNAPRIERYELPTATMNAIPAAP